MTTQHILSWQVGYAATKDEVPQRWVAAKVPGAVQLDWARANKWEPYYIADHWKAYRWMEDVYWTYRARLELPKLAPGERLFFISLGIDYRFAIYLNRHLIHAQEGMFTPVEIELTPQARSGDELAIVIFPVPKSHHEVADRTQANRSCKPAVSYGWDWHPRLIPLGIWDQTFIQVRAERFIQQHSLEYQLAENYAQVEVAVNLELSACAPGDRVIWELLDHAGDTSLAVEQTVQSAALGMNGTVTKPRLWWPHDHGEPYLYRSKIKLLASDGRVMHQCEDQVGFRRVKLVMHPGAWEQPPRFPISRSNPPITLEINGRQIFAKGTNWVPPEIFPGVITDDTYGNLLKLAKNAHMNLLRVWGGGIVNKESFYQQCDQLGLMVWSEFPLACNDYPDDPHYLEVLDQESRCILQRCSRHACNILWCGGNELFNAWSRMTDQSLALRLLNKNCYELDPHTPFLMTSPLMGMGHGFYCFRDEATDMDVFQIMQKSRNTAYTEFGVPGPASVEDLKSFIPQADLFPLRLGTAWESHHALRAWDIVPDTWMCQKTLDHYFGQAENLEQLVERGQWLQCEGYKAIFEEARRQKPRASMALNWCFNEPWPAAANNSIVSWPAKPKLAYAAVADSLRPTLASARIPKFAWRAGEIFEAELWLLHDDFVQVRGAIEVVASLGIEGREIELLTWKTPALTPNQNQVGPAASITLPPNAKAGDLWLSLAVADHPDWNSRYRLLIQPAQRQCEVSNVSKKRSK